MFGIGAGDSYYPACRLSHFTLPARPPAGLATVIAKSWFAQLSIVIGATSEVGGVVARKYQYG